MSTIALLSQQQQQQQAKLGRHGGGDEPSISRGQADNDDVQPDSGAFERRSPKTASKKRRQFRSSGADRHVQLPV